MTKGGVGISPLNALDIARANARNLARPGLRRAAAQMIVMLSDAIANTATADDVFDSD
jgi:hypothetical protein